MAIGKDLSGLMQTLGYTFRDPSLLQMALTHASFSFEQKNRGGRYPSNERLEFLGDAVLQLVISDELYRTNEHDTEGSLTKRRQTLVCERTLSELARSIGLGAYLHVGRGEELTDLRHRPKVLADAMEAVLAAVYLDDSPHGGARYAEVILRLMRPLLRERATPTADPKTTLQQLVEQDGAAELVYEVVAEDGPPHARQYTVCCLVNNNEVGRASARTIKDAQIQAAMAALTLFGIPTDTNM